MIKQFLSRFALMLLIAGPFVTLAPVYVEASTNTAVPGCTATTLYSPVTGMKCPVMPGSILGCTDLTAYSPVTGAKCTPATTATTSDATFDSPSLTIDSGRKPRITGTADVSKVRLTISDAGSTNVVYKSSRTSVHSGDWHVSVSKRLADGQYTVSLYQDNNGRLGDLLATGTLSVGIPPVTLKVLPVALLGGGTTNAGATVPISYLQVLNMSDATTTIAGFWVKENGTTPVNAVIGLSSVDDKGNYRMSTGGIEGKTPFVNGQAYVPSGAEIGPHQMKLFTIKAQLSAFAAQYVGTNLMLDIAGVDAPATFLTTFPVRGTTWTIGS